MGYRLKKIKNDEFAGGELTYFGVLVLIIGFVMFSTVLAHYIGWASESPYSLADVEMQELLMSSEYENMTSSDRDAWLNNHYGGEGKWGAFQTWGPFTEYYRYWGEYDRYNVDKADHYLSKDDYNDFLSGDYDITTDVSAFDIMADIMTLNLPILNSLGALGICIKLFIGVLFVFIIYLLLPFTG